MVKLRDWIPTLAAFVGTAVLTGEVTAQAEGDVRQTATVPDSLLGGASVTLKVDGMSCPFCAYGLEKRLREIPAVDTLIVRVSDGMVQIRVKEGQQLPDAELRDAVKRAGFTLREIHRVENP